MSENAVPERFGDYVVFEKLGVGGMAVVHRAKKQGIEGFSRVVALKRMLPELSADASFVRSFIREARLASYLQHANIVQIYDLGKVHDTYFMAMEYIQGRDLRKVLRWALHTCGPPPVEITLAIVYQLLDALHYAHTLHNDEGEHLGLVHRDISPSNLLLARDGNLKIIDFGIAKAKTAQLRTKSGAVKGKFAYMAPEVLSGEPADARTDLFSVGIVAYELLTTRPLFAGRSEYHTLSNVRSMEIIPPRVRNPRCSLELNDIVMTALSRDPQFRWQSAAAMRYAVENVARAVGRASSREVSEWMEWAFNLPMPRALRERENPPAQMPDGSAAGPGRPNIDSIDDVSMEIVWGTDSQARASVAVSESLVIEEFSAADAITADIPGQVPTGPPPPALGPPPAGPPPARPTGGQSTLVGVSRRKPRKGTEEGH